MRTSLPRLLAPLALCLSGGTAAAMGQPPSACTNLHEASIVDFVIVDRVDGRLVYPLRDPHARLRAAVGEGYDVYYVVFTNPRSESGNHDPGDYWLYQNAYGFGAGRCKTGASGEPDHFHAETITDVMMGQAYPGIVEDVEWFTLGPGRTVSYTVEWIAPQ